MEYLRGVRHLFKALLSRDLSKKEDHYRLALDHLLGAEDRRLSLVGDRVEVVPIKAAKRKVKRRLVPEMSSLALRRLTAVQRKRKSLEPKNFTPSRDCFEKNYALYFTCPDERFRIKRG